MIKKINENKKCVFFSAFLFIVFVALAYLFPYTGDDWDWGCINGIERFENFFSGYNGRYVGNILILGLTRSVPLKVFCVSTSLLIIGLAPKYFSGSKRFSALVFSFLLFFIMSRGIFIQSIVWSSGYANYATSTITILLFFLIIKDIFLEQRSEDSKKQIALKACFAFLLGFSGSLFVENVTIFNVVIAALIALYSFIRFRTWNFTSFGYFVGSLIATIIMFSNSVYGIISSGDDFYRTSILEEKNTDFIFDNLANILNLFFFENSLIFIVIAILCVVISVINIKFKKECKNKDIALASSIISLICAYIMVSKNAGLLHINCEETSGIVISLVLVLVYTASFVSFTVLGIADKTIKRKLLFLLLCTVIIIAPFLLVTPFGGRCLLTPHIFLVMINVILLNYIFDNWSFEKAIKILEISFVVLLSGLLIYTSYIYLDVHQSVKQREKIIEEQKQANCDTIVVLRLPHSEYCWRGNPYDSDILQDTFKLYYDIDEDVEIDCRYEDEFDAWYENFQKNLDENVNINQEVRE